MSSGAKRGMRRIRRANRPTRSRGTRSTASPMSCGGGILRSAGFSALWHARGTLVARWRHAASLQTRRHMAVKRTWCCRCPNASPA